MSKKLRYYGKWGVLLTHSRSSLSFDKTNKGLWNPRLLGRRTSGPDPRTLVRFPNCHECHSRSKWVGEPDYTDPDPTKKTGLFWCSVLIGRKERVYCSIAGFSVLASSSVDEKMANIPIISLCPNLIPASNTFTTTHQFIILFIHLEWSGWYPGSK